MICLLTKPYKAPRGSELSRWLIAAWNYPSVAPYTKVLASVENLSGHAQARPGTPGGGGRLGRPRGGYASRASVAWA